MHARFIRSALFAAAALASLSGCSSDDTSTAPKNCPPAAVLVPTSQMSVFKPNMQADPAGLIYRVHVESVKTNCTFDPDNGTTDSELQVMFKATRPPNASQVTYKVPYYVAVSQGERILTKKQFWVEFTFNAGETEADFKDHVASTFITLENGKKPYDYEILVGLQLTHDQLDYNNQGHYGP